MTFLSLGAQVLLLAAASGFSTRVAAQAAEAATPKVNGPTLAETIDFLVGLLSTNSPTVWYAEPQGKRSYWGKYLELTANGCILNMTTSGATTPNKQEFYPLRISLDLSKLDAMPTSGDDYVRVESRGALANLTLEVGRIHKGSFVPKNTEKIVTWDFFFSSPEYVPRARKALEHALNLCGAKLSPF
jgi:hypothetical protein